MPRWTQSRQTTLSSADVLRLLTGFTGSAEPAREVPAVSALMSEDLWRPVPSKVLFLDFDGVLHRKMTETFEHLPAFETWLRSTRDVGIVISSSWRDCDRSYLERIFSEDLRDRLIGRTVKEGLLKSRQDEILRFVSGHCVSNFVVLDDDNDEFDPSWVHRISTEYATGLTDRELALLARWSSNDRRLDPSSGRVSKHEEYDA